MSEPLIDALRRLIPKASSGFRWDKGEDGYDLFEMGKRARGGKIKPFGKVYEREFAELIVKALNWMLPAFNLIKAQQQTITELRNKVAGNPAEGLPYTKGRPTTEEEQ
jgi:hypothetical protein